MQRLKREKPYKAEEPFITINKIRKILEKINIFTIELNLNSGPLYSSRVYIEGLENVGSLGIGTSGKGMSRRYSLASAYGEFMERLQNGVLFGRKTFWATKQKLGLRNFTQYKLKEVLERNKLILSFEIASDERYLFPEEIINDCIEQLKLIFNESNKEILLKYLKRFSNTGKIACIPFYDVKHRSVKYFPGEILLRYVSSNGMSAGNTKEEALIQGICEIFERYAIKKIYKENITPPTIPLEYFKGTNIYNIIKDMESTKHISVIVKDCSLGLNLPVIGLLIIDYEKNKYTFHLSSDPSPITSLERCLAEIHQGGSEPRFKNLHISNDPFREKSNYSFQQNKYINFIKTLQKGSGYWPNCIFSNNYSYVFTKFEHPITKSDKEDLNYLIKKVFDLGYNLYIRDASYLGFPSFYIYIPGMSEVQNNSITFTYLKLNHNLLTLYNIRNSDTKSITKFANILEEVYSYDNNEAERLNLSGLLLPNTNKKLENITIELLLVMVFYRINNLKKAFKYINRYLERISDEPRSKYLYYYCVRDYLKLKMDNSSMDTVETNLMTFYGKKLAEMVIADFSDPQKIFNNIPLPNGFDCDNCEVRSDCKYLEILHYVKTLQEIEKENPIDQSCCLKEIFE